MGYKLLLAGKNPVIIDAFFNVMNEEFVCASTSTRGADIINHINFFQPDAFVYCITSETKENMEQMIEVLAGVDSTKLNLILIGDSGPCKEFTQLNPELVGLTLLKPIASSTIKQKIVQFLSEQITIREIGVDNSVQEEKAEEKKATEVTKANTDVDDKKHILVIDDDPMMLRLIKTELKEEYNVATAVSGKIGLSFLQRKKTDLILLDYEMPEENGAEIFQKIRAIEEFRNIPIVFLTGMNNREKTQKLLSMKPQGYLLKPIEHDKLLKTIRQIIG